MTPGRPRREAIVEVLFTDGTQMSEWSEMFGHGGDPMPREEVVAKARDLSRRSWKCNLAGA